MLQISINCKPKKKEKNYSEIVIVNSSIDWKQNKGGIENNLNTTEQYIREMYCTLNVTLTLNEKYED